MEKKNKKKTPVNSPPVIKPPLEKINVEVNTEHPTGHPCEPPLPMWGLQATAAFPLPLVLSKEIAAAVMSVGPRHFFLQQFCNSISQPLFLMLSGSWSCMCTHKYKCGVSRQPCDDLWADLRGCCFAKHMFCFSAEISHPTVQTTSGITKESS